MTAIQENIGVIYYPADGVIVKSITMALGQKVADHYTLKTGQAFIIGRNVSDPTLYTVDANEDFVPLSLPTPSLEQLKAAAKEQIDYAAGVERSNIGSQGYGQEMTYLAKEAEAKEVLADPSPVAANYPMIAAEVGITGPDLAAVASLVVSMASQWRVAAGAIEAVRMAAKASISAATSEAEIGTIIETIVWPTIA